MDGLYHVVERLENLLVAEVETTYLAQHTEYKVVAVSGPVVDIWIDTIDKILDRTDVFIIRENIQEDEILTVQTSTTETWTWTETWSLVRSMRLRISLARW